MPKFGRVGPMSSPGPLKPMSSPDVRVPLPPQAQPSVSTIVIERNMKLELAEKVKVPFYQGGSKCGFISRIGSTIVAFHMLLTFVLFIGFECLEYIMNLRIEALVPVGTFLLGVTALIFMCAFILVEPGAMNNLEPDLQNLELRYYEMHEKEVDSPHKVLKDVNYYGEVVKGDFCFFCFRFKDIQTIHCVRCNHCIARFDHHCRFFQCCIGLRNFKYFYWYQVFLTLYYCSVIAFSVYRFIKEDSHAIVVFLLLGNYVVLMFVGEFGLPFNALVYSYLICKGRTAYETWYRLKICKLCPFQKEIHGKIHNKLMRKYFNRCNCFRNWADFLCRKTPRSVLNDPKVVFDYESGDTESKSSTSSFSTSESSSTYSLTPVDSENGFPIRAHRKGCARCWHIFCKCCKKSGPPPVDPSTFVYSEKSAQRLGIPKNAIVR